MKYRNLMKFLLAIGVLGMSLNASATSFDRVDTDQLVDEAELIFEGTVTDVSYRNSDSAGKEDAEIPHTYVTFMIDRQYKGSAVDGDRITLRFQGGPNGKGDMMLIPGVPLFDVGDSDVMFVSKNGEAICPLVGWEQGRMRQINGEVFTEQGRQLWLDPNGRLQFGGLTKLEEVLTHQMGELALTFELEPISPDLQLPVGAIRLRTDRLSELLNVKVKQRIDQGKFVDLQPVLSANVTERLVVAPSTSSAPPAADESIVPVPDSDEQYERELTE